MANLKLRFSIYTRDPKDDIALLSEKVSVSNRVAVYKIGDINGKTINKESAIDYVYAFDRIDSLEAVNVFFMQEWKGSENILRELNGRSFKSYLLYEFEMDGFTVFPEMGFSNEFLTFMASAGVELQLYYYPIVEDGSAPE